MSKKIIGVFNDRTLAEKAVKALRDAGFDREISVLSKQEDADKDRQDEGLTMGADMGNLSTGITTGGVLGGLAGLAVGAGAMVIPGIGPLIAAGPIAGLLSGAATGGIAGGLVDWGIPEAESKRYEDDVRQGKTLVSVEADAKKSDDAAKILNAKGAISVKAH